MDARKQTIEKSSGIHKVKLVKLQQYKCRMRYGKSVEQAMEVLLSRGPIRYSLFNSNTPIGAHKSISELRCIGEGGQRPSSKALSYILFFIQPRSRQTSRYLSTHHVYIMEVAAQADLEVFQ